MTIESAIMTNLERAHAVQKAGFKSKVHAIQMCPVCGVNHKQEIDQMIAHKFGKGYICSWMKKTYPECDSKGMFPSSLALSRYIARHYEKSETQKELEKQILDKFNPIKEALALYNIAKRRLSRAMFLEDTGGVPTSMVSDLFKLKQDALKSVIGMMADFKEVEKGTAGIGINIYNDNRSVTNISADDKKTIIELAREAGLFSRESTVGDGFRLVEGGEQAEPSQI